MYTYIKSRYWKHWAISLLLMCVIGYVMKAAPCLDVPDLIAIEFANTSADLMNMISFYAGGDCNALYNNTLADFVFMVAYSLLFYFSGRVICDLLEFGRTKWLFLLLLPLVLDVIENLMLLLMIEQGVRNVSFTAFYYAVRVKWLLVIPAVLVTVTVALYQLYAGIDKVYCWWIQKRK